MLYLAALLTKVAALFSSFPKIEKKVPSVELTVLQASYLMCLNLMCNGILGGSTYLI